MTNGVGNPTFNGSTDTMDESKERPVQNGDWHSSRDPLASCDDDDEASRCGYGSCKPNRLQVCNNPKMVLFCLCWFAFIQGFVVNGINNVNTTTIERRFSLPSSQVGLISSSYDIAAGLTVLPMTYFGTFAHQPRMLALAAFSLSLGSFVMSLPHFVTDVYDYGQTSGEQCIMNGTDTACGESTGSISNYLYVFILGQLLHGYGGSCLYTIGVVYIDSNVKTKNSPFYQGILMASSTLGPAVGYLMGGYFLELYVDFNALDASTIPITSSDPRWVGAWWIGFVFSGSMFLIIVFLIFPFPKMTPAGLRALHDRQSQAHQNGSEDICKEDTFLKSWRDAPKALKILVTNPVFMFTSFANVTESMVISGFATFLPKIIQNQFSLTSGWSALLAGFVAVPGTVLGNLLGGGIMKCMQLKVRGMLRFCIMMCLLSAAVTFVSLCKCELPPFAGVSRPYDSPSSSLSDVDLTWSCNEDCACSQSSYQPVCGSNGVQYFTPCHAGCVTVNTTGDTNIYSDCSCVALDSAEASARDEPCDAPCTLLPVFLPFFALVIMLTFMSAIPGLNVTLRCIPDKQRSFGLGVNAVLFRFLGTFPGPLLFGSIFDNACLVWEVDDCDGQGSCWVYDNAKLATNLLALSLTIKLVSSIFFTLAHFTYKPPPDVDEDERQKNVVPVDNPVMMNSVSDPDNPPAQDESQKSSTAPPHMTHI